MSRLPILTTNDRSPEQQRLFESITGGARSSVPRKSKMADDEGRLNGPFNAMLYAPAIGDAAQKLGSQLRFESTLPGMLRETAILTVAQFWRSNYEWVAHARIARAEGLGDEAIEQILAGNQPSGNDELAAVHSCVSVLLQTRRVGDETYAQALSALGDVGVVELVTLTGYYCLISVNLNAFEVALPGGETPPFGDENSE
jgi:4-carboxymuconolactone decarboxylase